MPHQRADLFRLDGRRHLIDLVVAIRQHENDQDSRRERLAWQRVGHAAVEEWDAGSLPAETSNHVSRDDLVRLAETGEPDFVAQNFFFRMRYHDKMRLRRSEERPHVPMFDFAITRIAEALPGSLPDKERQLHDFFLYEYAGVVFAEAGTDGGYVADYEDLQRDLDSLQRSGFTARLIEALRAHYPDLVAPTLNQEPTDNEQSDGSPPLQGGSTPSPGEWSAPMTLAEMARRITGNDNARGRKIKPFLAECGLRHISGIQYQVRLDTMDRNNRAKIEKNP